MNRAMVYILETRPQFLTMAVACVLVGAGAAFWKSGQINLIYLALILIGAMAAHASVNILNDYDDYKSGLDEMTVQTPFSGGSKLLPGKKLTPRATLIYGVATLGLTALIGLYFTYAQGWQLLLVGVPGVVLIVLYTRYITRSPILCLLAPGLGFGTCMVMGTYYVLQGFYDLTALAVSIIPLFFVSNLLLINQFPDIEADRAAGRRHLLVTLPSKQNAYIYSALNFGAFLALVAGVWLQLLPPLLLAALICIPLAWHTSLGVIKHHDNIKNLVPFLSKNVILILATLVIIAVSLFIA